MKKDGRLRTWMTLVAACCTAFAAIYSGRVICLCSDDPDGCGESCHVCGDKVPDGLSPSERCNHFSIGDVDFWAEDENVTAVGDGNLSAVCPWARSLECNQIFIFHVAAMSANAPPDGCPDVVLFLARRILLLS